MFSFEGFSCCLDVFYGGQGISKLLFLIKKSLFSDNIVGAEESFSTSFNLEGEKKPFFGKRIKPKNLLTGAAAPLGEVAGQLALSFRHLLITHQQAHHSSAHSNHVV
jgi:hypothetical protein